MKRFFFWFLVALVAITWVRNNHRARDARLMAEIRHWHAHHDEARAVGPDGRPIGGRPPVAVRPGPDQIVRFDMNDDDDDDDFDFRIKPSRSAREQTDDLPVRIVPGTKTTEARIEPPKPPRPPAPPKFKRQRPARPAPAPVQPLVNTPQDSADSVKFKITGLRSATEQRARDSSRTNLATAVSERFGHEIPSTWKIPSALVDAMIREVTVAPIERDYGTVYEATIKAEITPDLRTKILQTYHREQVMSRLTIMGAALGFVLACLAALSGYIKTDEATKGYYTTRLRLVSTAAAGAAGFAIYRWLA